MNQYTKMKDTNFHEDKGWDENEQNFTFSPNQRFNFLKQFEKKRLEKSRMQQKQKSWERLNRLRSTNARYSRINNQKIKQTDEIRFKSPSICNFLSLDLNNNCRNRKCRWNKEKQQPCRMPKLRTDPLPKHSNLADPKKSHPPKNINLQDNISKMKWTRMIKVQLHELAQIDSVTNKYLQDYFKKKEEMNYLFPKRQKIFQIPIHHSYT